METIITLFITIKKWAVVCLLVCLSLVQSRKNYLTDFNAIFQKNLKYLGVTEVYVRFDISFHFKTVAVLVKWESFLVIYYTISSLYFFLFPWKLLGGSCSIQKCFRCSDGEGGGGGVEVGGGRGGRLSWRGVGAQSVQGVPLVRKYSKRASYS